MTVIDVTSVINMYYPPGAPVHDLFMDHSRRVRDKALAIAEGLKDQPLDLSFIQEAAMLHDIGIFKTNAQAIHCSGDVPYICHGVIGREMLEAHGLYRHALVCERHVGTGLTVEDIIDQNLPLPLRDMTPHSLEEIIICYADKFFTKANGHRELSLERVIKGLARYGEDKVETFLRWHQQFTTF